MLELFLLALKIASLTIVSFFSLTFLFDLLIMAIFRS
jgi:hypothetical protein